MRGILVAGLLLLTLLAVSPTADARPPEPGGHCDVKEEYVTEAALTKDENGLPVLQPGAPRPIECYY